jgi:hypothetical protein
VAGLLDGVVGETVTVTVLVLVLPGSDEGTVVAAPPVVTAVSVGVVTTVVLVVVAVEVAVADAEPMTPHATRMPESPVDSVSWSAPGAPFFWV